MVMYLEDFFNSHPSQKIISNQDILQYPYVHSSHSKNVKPIVIIAISVVCSVVAVLAIQFLISGEDIGESITSVVPFDCAKAWDEMNNSLRIQDNNAFQKLSQEEQREIRKYNGLIRDEFHANWCYLNHEEWQDRAIDKDGRILVLDKGIGYLSWEEAISDEFRYNVKFPDGAYQDW